MSKKTFGSPISGGACAVFLARKNNHGLTCLCVFMGDVENIIGLFSGNVNGLGTHFAHHFVDDSGVGEGSTSHYFIIS